MTCNYFWVLPGLFVSNNSGKLIESKPVTHVCAKNLFHHGFHQCVCGELIYDRKE